MNAQRRSPITIVAAALVGGLLLALLPAGGSAQSLNGAIYQAEAGSPPIYFFFSVSGPTFVVGILTYGAGGNGRWFAAAGNTDGVSGTGPAFSPSGFTLTQPVNTTFHFQLDGPGSAGGSFSTTGLSSFLSPVSGRIVRIFP
jgi:hypothetical protein